MRAVVTGATGALGMALIKILMANQVEVTVITRPDSARNSRLELFPDISIIHCSLEKLDTLAKTNQLMHADYFFHLAWRGTTGLERDNLQLQMQNVVDTLNAVECASNLGCKVFVGAGSQAEYGLSNEKLSQATKTNPYTGYGVAKLCAGQMSRLACSQRNIKHIWTRILSVYGPFDTDNSMIISGIRKMLRDEVTEFSKAEQLWDYIYSDDAARALYLCAICGKDKAVYPIGSGNALPLKNYITTMSKLCEAKNVPGIGKLPYSEKQIMYLCADIEALCKDTGFQIEVDFNEGIKRTIEWCRLTGV